MIIPVRCFTCGNILASKYDRYRKLKAQQSQINDILDLNKFVNVNETNTLNNDTNMCNELMKQVGLKRYCCKRHFLGQLNILEYI